MPKATIRGDVYPVDETSTAAIADALWELIGEQPEPWSVMIDGNRAASWMVTILGAVGGQSLEFQHSFTGPDNQTTAVVREQFRLDLSPYIKLPARGQNERG